jgi:4-amino-4-deoxy-L-arabinose transferase-like glycosyltransferase
VVSQAAGALSRFQISVLVYICLSTLVLAVIAWAAPPNSWDSMTYHMSRVVHWVQNRSVAFYPTNISRQLHLTPWSEFAILHVQILSGNDRFANFVQWFSMAGSLVAVSLVAKELNASMLGQVFAAAACASIPMGIMQSTSTQTDYVVAFWLVCFVYFAMLLRKRPGALISTAGGAALGLSVLTKATACIFALPFCLWLGIASIRNHGAKALPYLFAAVTIALAMNSGQFARNYNLYGDVLGPRSEGGSSYAYANETHSVPAVTSNLVRNVALQLGTPWKAVDASLTSAIFWLHKLLGISPNDPRTTWTGTDFQVSTVLIDEGGAPNVVQVILIVSALLLYALGKDREAAPGPYAAAALGGFLLFSAALKWQPWHSRLLLPLFVLWTPFIGATFSRIRRPAIVKGVLVAVLVTALPWVVLNQNKSLVGKNSIFARSRTDQYFTYFEPWRLPYIRAADTLAAMNCFDVGLAIYSDSWEYPIWILLRERTSGPVRLEHVNVTDVSARLREPGPAWAPCAIFRINTSGPEPVSVERVAPQTR